MEACERLATRVPRAFRFGVSQNDAVPRDRTVSRLVSRRQGAPRRPACFSGGGPQKKYRRFTGGMRWKLQCKALRRREKSRRRKNRGNQGKNRRGTMEQADIRARADASPGSYRRRQIESPAAERRRAHKSKTRISAVAHPSAERTSKLKSAPVIPAALSKKVAILARMRSPAVNPQAPRRTGRPRRAAPPCC